MPPFVFDEEGVEGLAQRFLVGGDRADDLAVVVDRRVDEVRGLERAGSAAAAVGSQQANEAAVAKALQAAEVDLGGLVAGARSLRSLVEVWREASSQLVRRVADVRAAAITLDDLAEVDLLADVRAERPEDVVRISGASVRSFLPDLPEPGLDPELDAALARFDSELLPVILAGELDPSTLTDRQRRDLQRVTDLLGGDEVVAFVEERLDFVEVGGEDQSITVTTEITFSQADPEFQAAFVRSALTKQAAAATLAAASSGGPEIDVSTISGVGGREGGESQQFRSGEVSFDGGPTISTEVVDLGGGLERVTVTDPTTGTQFTGVRAELENGYAVSGDITFADGSTGTVDVVALDGDLEIEIESGDLTNRGSALSRDLNRTAPTGFGLVDTLVDIFENFSLFGTNPEPFDPTDPEGSGGESNNGGGYDAGWSGGGHGTENDGDYNNNYSGI